MPTFQQRYVAQVDGPGTGGCQGRVHRGDPVALDHNRGISQHPAVGHIQHPGRPDHDGLVLLGESNRGQEHEASDQQESSTHWVWGKGNGESITRAA